MLGFLYGFDGLEKHFDRDFSEKYDINRTRINFGGGESYDTYHDDVKTVEQYIGYTFNSKKSFSKVIFQEGRHSVRGGWFANNTLQLQVLKNGKWKNAKSQASPAYPNGNDLATFGDDFSNYTFTLNETGTGIRLIGKAGGKKHYISISELEVYNKDKNIASEGEIIATVKYPTGNGTHNIEAIRNGIKDTDDEEIDNFTDMAERLLPLIDKVVIEQMNGTATSKNWTINSKPAANKYYISSVNGKINGDGSENNPWNTLENIDGYKFSPGDSVFFERGSKWRGSFEITASGSLNAPIVFTSFGTGERPAISNPDSSVNNGNAIRISASHILINDFYIHDCGLSKARNPT